MAEDQSPAFDSAHSPPASRKPRRRLVYVALAAVVALALILTPGRTKGSNAEPGSKGKKEGAAAPAVPVVATRARRGDIGVYFTGLGAVTSREVKYREGE